MYVCPVSIMPSSIDTSHQRHYSAHTCGTRHPHTSTHTYARATPQPTLMQQHPATLAQSLHTQHTQTHTQHTAAAAAEDDACTLNSRALQLGRRDTHAQIR